VSPANTKSILLTNRPADNDTDTSGFMKWPMSTVHFWGESVVSGSSSNWQLIVGNAAATAVQLEDWSLIFHGTEK
jgi:subtilisin-like proprotein convertase family protein